MEKYHSIIHYIANLLGYQYDQNAPDWLHPILHFVLFFAPLCLALVTSYICIKWIKNRIRQKHLAPAKTLSGYIRGLDNNLFRFVFKSSIKQQSLLLIASLIAMPILYGTLELPKQIINNALDANRFPFVYRGLEITQVDFLLFLCGLYLGTILINGLHKYWLNVYKGRVAERFLRRLRLLIYRQWRNDGRGHGKADIIPILSQEVEPIGGFAADILTLPVFQGGTLLTIMAFMFVQEPILGIAAIAILPLQLVLLPRLQRRVNTLARARIQEMRKLGSELGAQITATGSQMKELHLVATQLRKLEHIRRDIHRRKFFIKAFNNVLTSLTPVFFYSLGGYFVIEDRITLGALVAVLAAHKDFSAPLKELFRYYQTLEDVRVRYFEIFKFFPVRPVLVSQKTTFTGTQCH